MSAAGVWIGLSQSGTEERVVAIIDERTDEIKSTVKSAEHELWEELARQLDRIAEDTSRNRLLLSFSFNTVVIEEVHFSGNGQPDGLVEALTRFTNAISQRIPAEELSAVTRRRLVLADVELAYEKGQDEEVLTLLPKAVVEEWESQDLEVVSEHLDTGTGAHLFRANSLYRMRRWRDAAESYERILQLYLPALGTSSHSRATYKSARFNLANCFLRLDRLDEAMAHYDTLIDVYRKEHVTGSRGGRLMEMAVALNNRGLAHFQQHAYQAATEDYRESLAIFQEQSGRPDVQRLTLHRIVVSSNLGLVLAAQGELVQGIKKYDAAIEGLQDKAIHTGNADVSDCLAVILSNRGDAKRQLGGLEQARSDHKHAIRILRAAVERARTPEHRWRLAVALGNRGVTLHAGGLTEESFWDHDESVTILRDVTGSGQMPEFSDDLARALGNRATVQTPEEIYVDFGEAVSLYQDLIEHEGRSELKPELALVLADRGAVRLGRNVNDLPDRTKAKLAVEDLSRAVSIFESYTSPERTGQFARGLASALRYRAIALQLLDDESAAIDDYLGATLIFGKLMPRDGGTQFTEKLCRSLHQYYRLLQRLDRQNEPNRIPAIVLEVDCREFEPLPTDAQGRRITCRSNMSGIKTSMKIYAKDHGGRFPPDFESLVESDLVTEAQFRCPSLTTGRDGLYASFEYITGQTIDSDPQNVLLFETGAYHGEDGGHVGYVGGSIEFVNPYERVKELVRLTRGRIGGE